MKVYLRPYFSNSTKGKDLYRLAPIELDTVDVKRIPRRGKKSPKGGKKVENYYSYSKPGYFARNYRFKNIV